MKWCGCSVFVHHAYMTMPEYTSGLTCSVRLDGNMPYGSRGLKVAVRSLRPRPSWLSCTDKFDSSKEVPPERLSSCALDESSDLKARAYDASMSVAEPCAPQGFMFPTGSDSSTSGCPAASPSSSANSSSARRHSPCSTQGRDCQKTEVRCSQYTRCVKS